MCERRSYECGGIRTKDVTTVFNGNYFKSETIIYCVCSSPHEQGTLNGRTLQSVSVSCLFLCFEHYQTIRQLRLKGSVYQQINFRDFYIVWIIYVSENLYIFTIIPELHLGKEIFDSKSDVE